MLLTRLSERLRLCCRVLCAVCVACRLGCLRLLQVKFLTKIWHPNVDYEKGEPCVDFLTESWKPEMTLRHVLQTVRGLMALPNAGAWSHPPPPFGSAPTPHPPPLVVVVFAVRS